MSIFTQPVWGDTTTVDEINKDRQQIYPTEIISPVLRNISVSRSDIEQFFQAHPPALRSRYSLYTLATRVRIHNWIKYMLLEARKRYDPSAQAAVKQAQACPNMLLPKRIAELTQAWDCIATALVRQAGTLEQSALLIMENIAFTQASAQAGYHEPGVGKTGLTFTLLGMTDFIKQLPPLPTNLAQFAQTDFAPVIATADPATHIKVAAIDHTFIGLSPDQQLVVSPIAGVIGFDGQSDITRYATRVLSARVGRTYNRLQSPDAEYFALATQRLFVDHRAFVPTDAFVPWQATLGINFITTASAAEHWKKYLEQRDVRVLPIADGWIALEDIADRQSVVKQLEPLLLGNPMYHPSPAWAGKDPNPARQLQSGINPAHHTATIQAVRTHWPRRLAFLYIYPGGSNYQPATASQYFQGAAQSIQNWWQNRF